ncbi:MAG: hypothetical protein LAN62_19145 [Acidobacteriia bacterium]|nr:hypothetical protein [Terriglobia bacterium]
MEEDRFEEVSAPSTGRNRWLAAAAIVFFIATVACGIYIAEQRQKSRQLTAGYDQMSLALNQTRSQLDTVTAKLNSLTAPPPPEPAPSTPPPEAPKAQHVTAKHTRAQRTPAEDPHWKQLQAQLSDQQKQLDATRQDVEKTRSDLEGKLGSTRDELNGSIARTHDELVALEKKGLRNYVEFDLAKSKQFHRAGPISVSLRKANTKRGYCDLKLIVDDVEVDKKHVNLFEPVLFYPADYAQPLELVINQIDRNEARGYVSVPKFRQSELSASSEGATATQQGGQPSPAPSTASLDRGRATNPR